MLDDKLRHALQTVLDDIEAGGETSPEWERARDILNEYLTQDRIHSVAYPGIPRDTTCVVQIESAGRTYALGIDRKECDNDAQFMRGVIYLFFSAEMTLEQLHREQVVHGPGLSQPGFIPRKQIT